MSRRNEVFSVYLKPHQAEALRAISRRTKVPISEYIRDAVDRVLVDHRDHIQPEAGAWAGGVS